VALAEDLELDRVAVWDVHEAVEEHNAVVEAETRELALNVVVSGNVEVAQEREQGLEGRILGLGGADVADELGLVAGGTACGNWLTCVDWYELY
jgi:hypothetical protein